MADQHDKSVPNRAANMEQAEGSRDTATEPNAGGITNRSREQEEREQRELPPRGRTRVDAMRHDARPTGEKSSRDDAGRQEQAIQRSPAGASRPGSSVDDERTASSNTQHAGGLSGGSPGGQPARTPERVTAEDKPFVTAADPADEDTNVTNTPGDKSRR